MHTANSETAPWRESSFKALIPFIVFVIFYFGFSIATQDFSKVPMTVAFIISSAAALILNHKEKLNKKIEIFDSFGCISNVKRATIPDRYS